MKSIDHVTCDITCFTKEPQILGFVQLHIVCDFLILYSHTTSVELHWSMVFMRIHECNLHFLWKGLIAIDGKLMRPFFVYVSLDPEQKDQLIEVIEKLLADKTTVSNDF